MIRNLHKHFIVCGFGRVGRNASFQLQQQSAPFVVLDRDKQRIEKATNAGMLAMEGDATQDDSLREAGVMRAKGLIAALPSDAENLFIILSAKALNPALVVVTRASEEEAGEKLRRAGADTVLAPYAIAGRQLADALLKPHVVEFLDFARTDLSAKVSIEQICVGSHGAFRGKTLAELLAIRHAGAMVLAVHREGGETIFNPSSDVRISDGDFLIIMGEKGSLKELEKKLTF